MIHRRHRRDVWEKEPGFGPSEVESVNAERIELLNRKLSNSAFSAEDQTRLDLLTVRVRDLAPRFTEKDWEHLREFERRLDERETILHEVRKLYAISKVAG